jgi:hypothetical protein
MVSVQTATVTLREALLARIAAVEAAKRLAGK